MKPIDRKTEHKSNDHIYQAFFPLSNNKDAYISHLALHSQIPRKAIQHYRLFFMIMYCKSVLLQSANQQIIQISNGILTGAAYV